MKRVGILGTILTTFLIIAGAFEWHYHWLFPRNYTSYWQSGTLADRAPAGELTSRLEDELNVALLSDYFAPNDFAKLVRYEMEPRFWTDKDQDFLRERLFKTIHETINGSLEDKSSSPSSDIVFTTLIKKNLSESFLKNFVKTIQVHNLINATFQFDLFFTPKIERNLDFNRELSSNQLINLESKGKLYREISEKDKSQIDSILLAKKLPFDGNQQYMGGSLTLWMKVLDTAWNPLKPIPNPKKNAIKGFLRFRKYIRINKKVSPTSNHGIIKMLHVAPVQEDLPVFYTVDVYKSFNLGDLEPKLDRLEIFPGLLVPNNPRKGSLIARVFAKDEKDFETATFNAIGKVNATEFDAQLKKLVYDFSKKKWLWDSNISIQLRDDLTPRDSSLVKSQIKKELLSNSTELIVKSLGLEALIELRGRE